MFAETFLPKNSQDGIGVNTQLFKKNISTDKNEFSSHTKMGSNMIVLA